MPGDIAYFLKHGTTPTAEAVARSKPVTQENPNRAVYVVDWDGTCVTEEWPGMGDWLPGAVEALHALSAKGKTVIYSLRCHLYEMDDTTPRIDFDVRFEVNRVRAKLDAVGLQHIDIYPPNRGKPPGKFYIDDRAVQYHPDHGWDGVLRSIAYREELACANAS